MVFVCGRRSCTAQALETATHFNMLASSFRHLEEAKPREENHQAKWDVEAMHNALQATTVLFRIFRERFAVLRLLKPSPVAERLMTRPNLAALVTRFNVDTMA